MIHPLAPVPVKTKYGWCSKANNQKVKYSVEKAQLVETIKNQQMELKDKREKKKNLEVKVNEMAEEQKDLQAELQDERDEKAQLVATFEKQQVELQDECGEKQQHEVCCFPFCPLSD